MANLFTKHPHDVGETYFQHLRLAIKYGIQMLIAGIICLIHAIFPFLFKSTASTILRNLIQEFDARKKSPE